jgi:hypothetical protein
MSLGKDAIRGCQPHRTSFLVSMSALDTPTKAINLLVDNTEVGADRLARGKV